MVTSAMLLDQIGALRDRIEHGIKSSERGIQVIYTHWTARLRNAERSPLDSSNSREHGVWSADRAAGSSG
jgi:hypothetical protein